jgi:hypothetical protein
MTRLSQENREHTSQLADKFVAVLSSSTIDQTAQQKLHEENEKRFSEINSKIDMIGTALQQLLSRLPASTPDP